MAGGTDVSVVIATLRRPESLAETLASILECEPLPGEIIVVDGDPRLSAKAVVDASLNGTVDGFLAYHASPTGLTHQRNVGLDAARHGVVIYLDDDVTIPRHTFAAIVDAYGDPGIVGVTGRVLGDRSRLVRRESSLRRWLPGGGREGAFTRYGYPRYVGSVNEPLDVEHMSGCFMSARRDLAREVRFDEELPGYALAEDEDFSHRLARRGRIRYLPGVAVRHRLAPHEPSAQLSRALNRMLVRNRAYLFRKNFPQTRLARVQFAMLLLVLAAHRLLRRDLAAVRGIVDGTVDIAREASYRRRGRSRAG